MLNKQFSGEDRRVYGPFFNGAEDVYLDPLAADRKLKLLLGGDINKVLSDYNSDIASIALPAGELFVYALCEAFGLKKFDPKTGTGATERDCIKLWNDYQEWTEKKNGKDSNSVTSSPPTQDSSPSTTSTMENSAGSTSVPSGCGCD